MIKNVFWLGLATTTSAMQFSTTRWQNEPAILATGEIVAGDAKRLENVLKNTPQAAHGKHIILLSSSGGSVGSAFEISALFERYPVHTVIPKNAKCASACASVLFIAGENRSVEEGGLFGQHSCALEGKRNEECNEILAQHAVQHGVAYGNVKAFVNYADPADMIWLTREDVDGWNISRYPFSAESQFNGEPAPYFMLLFGQDFPPPSTRWRVDFTSRGAKAFVRVIANHEKAGEMILFCRKNDLFLGFYLPGEAREIKEKIDFATINAPPIYVENLPVEITPADESNSLVLLKIPHHDGEKLLAQAEVLQILIDNEKLAEPIRINTILSGSRQALNFAANHCHQ